MLLPTTLSSISKKNCSIANTIIYILALPYFLIEKAIMSGNNTTAVVVWDAMRKLRAKKLDIFIARRQHFRPRATTLDSNNTR